MERSCSSSILFLVLRDFGPSQRRAPHRLPTRPNEPRRGATGGGRKRTPASFDVTRHGVLKTPRSSAGLFVEEFCNRGFVRQGLTLYFPGVPFGGLHHTSTEGARHYSRLASDRLTVGGIASGALLRPPHEQLPSSSRDARPVALHLIRDADFVRPRLSLRVWAEPPPACSVFNGGLSSCIWIFGVHGAACSRGRLPRWTTFLAGSRSKSGADGGRPPRTGSSTSERVSPLGLGGRARTGGQWGAWGRGCLVPLPPTPHTFQRGFAGPPQLLTLPWERPKPKFGPDTQRPLRGLSAKHDDFPEAQHMAPIPAAGPAPGQSRPTPGRAGGRFAEGGLGPPQPGRIHCPTAQGADSDRKGGRRLRTNTAPWGAMAGGKNYRKDLPPSLITMCSAPGPDKR